MQINLTPNFRKKFENIYEYIAKDKATVAKKFKKELFKKIDNLPYFPYKFRKSFYFDDENIRDLIFKGYTIIYEIKEQEDVILVLDIFGKNKPEIAQK